MTPKYSLKVIRQLPKIKLQFRYFHKVHDLPQYNLDTNLFKEPHQS